LGGADTGPLAGIAMTALAWHHHKEAQIPRYIAENNRSMSFNQKENLAADSLQEQPMPNR
jgi:hypothetical protein